MNSTNALRAATLVLGAFGLLNVASAEVVATEGWARGAAPDAAAVGYLLLTNRGDADAKLLKIVSPVSDKVLIQRSSINNEGVARMWAVARLQIAPGESVRFEPSGMRVTFMDLKMPLTAGQQIPLQITFEGEAEFTVMLEVRPLSN